MNHWEGENDPYKRMLPQPFSNPRPPEIVRKKKSACKINENDLKIAWNALSGNPVLKISRGRPPDPLIKGEPLSYSPPLAARYMPSAVNALPHPPPPPRLQTFWVQPCYNCHWPSRGRGGGRGGEGRVTSYI